MSDPRAGDSWMPDLCRLPRLAAMLGMAELVVVVVVLAPGTRGWDFDRFLPASGYALWLALIVTGLLCLSRRALSRWPPRTGAILAVGAATVVAGIAAAIVHSVFSIVADPANPWSGMWRFVAGSAGIVALITALALRYFYVIDGWQAQVGANARAQADALQARIRPHFLFNSMNMIASLLRRDPAVAERAVLDLSDLFRAALGAGEGNSTLAEEVHLAERYLAIEQLRLGPRLQVDWDKSEPLPWNLPMPRLVLQPLLENAVLHGISPLTGGGCIQIALSADERTLTLRVRNPAPAPGPGTHGAQGAGHAQRSIADRLGYAFGARARMTSGWDAGYYLCELSLPLA